jgi:hypothetical protein
VEAELLQQRLRSVGRRLLAVRTLGGFGWGAVAAVVLVFVAVWLDLLWELPPGLRAAALVIAPTIGIVLLLAAVWQARRRGTTDAVARQIDETGGAAGRIRTGVDLVTADRTSPLTAGLAALAVADASELAGRVPTSRVAPVRPAAWPFAGLALLAAVVGVVAAIFPRLAEAEWRRFTNPFGGDAPFSRVIFHVEPGDTQVVYGRPLDVKVTTEGVAVERLSLVLEPADGSGEEVLPMFAEPGGAWRATVANLTADVRYHIRAHAGRSQRFAVRVLTVPKIDAVRFRVTPPAYTNRPAYEGPLPKGGLAGLPGARVEVWAASNRPLSGGTLRFTPPSSGPVALTPVSPGGSEVTGSFEIRAAGQLRLKVTDRDGQESADTFTAPIALLTDERPIVRLLEPREVSVATPTATLPVVIAAEDDYGIARVQLFRSLNDSRAMPIDVPVKPPAPTRVYEVIPLQLAAYGLEPGDEIKLFARAEDNDPAGAKGAESPVVVVRIISQEDFEKMVRAREGLELLMSKYQQARRRLEGLAAEAEEMQKKQKDQPKDAAATDEDRKDLQKLAERARKDAEAIREAAKKQLGYDLDKHLTPHLEKLSRELEAAAKELEEAAKKGGLTKEQMSKALEKLGGQLDRQKQETDRETGAPLERLGQVMPLMEDSAGFIALAQRQRDLATRMKSLKDQEKPSDPATRARMRDLRDEQEEIRIALSKLLDDIEDHAAKLPDDPDLNELRDSAKKFAEDVRASGASEAMGAAEAGLGEFSGPRGHDNADKAAGILEKFIGRCDGMGGMMGQGMRALRFQPKLSACLGNTVEQLLAEAGLMPGEGADGMMGQGSGRGSSARRNTAQNIGLYGGLPGLSESRGTGRMGGSGPAGPGAASQGRQAGQPMTATGSKPPGTTGTSDVTVPAPYRRRVAEYFQRVADETGGNR